jgi:hypothetical protein
MKLLEKGLKWILKEENSKLKMWGKVETSGFGSKQKAKTITASQSRVLA